MTGQLLLPRALAYGRQISYTFPGPVAIGVGTLVYYNDTGFTWEIGAVRATLITAASTGDTTADVKKNGTSIFASTGDRPTITATTTTDKTTTIGTPLVADGEYLSVDIAAAGTGADTLMITITLR